MINIYLIKYADLQQAKESVLDKYSQVKGKVYTIEHLPNGAPQLLLGGKPEGCVSISHTDGVLVMAFFDDKVGVDIERADRVVSPKICKSIERWTAIEAYAKWTGNGLSKEIIHQQIPEDIIHTIKRGEYVISICSQCQNIEITQLA
ncbi:MAG: hypothetical protein K2K85_04530 [Clostridia bacterium]|nr:hypothetical protein [Clostridia bacterium]